MAHFLIHSDLPLRHRSVKRKTFPCSAPASASARVQSPHSEVLILALVPRKLSDGALGPASGSNFAPQSSRKSVSDAAGLVTLEKPQTERTVGHL